MTSELGEELSRPGRVAAPVHLRMLAGGLDALLLGVLAAGLSLAPMTFGGFALPLLGILAAVLVYAVAPAALFKKTIGLALFDLELVHVSGRPAEATELLFRELIGRGLLGVAYLGTALLGLLGTLSGRMQFFVPTGIGLILFFLSGLLVLFGAVSHVFALASRDGRALHDLMVKTMVISRSSEAEEEPLDEEERAWASRRRAKRIRGFVLFEIGTVALALGLPYAASRPDQSLDLQTRVALERAEARFEEDPSDQRAARELIVALTDARQTERISEIERRHAEARSKKKKSDDDYKVRKYRVLLKNNPCSLTYSVKLASAINATGDYEETLRFIDQSFEECGKRTRLLWSAEYAHRKRENYAGAAAACTELIHEDPNDSDFWWWRGRDHGLMGKNAAAESDYRHSMAAKPNKWAASYFAKLVKEHDPCEGAFTLDYFIDERPDQAGDWATKERNALLLAGGCEKKRARGRASLRVKPTDDLVRAKAVVGGKKGRFVVYGTGFVTVTRAFADRASLTPGAEEVEVFVAGDFVPAHLARAAEIRVDQARVEDVPVAVVDTLPGAVDGYLGLSFTQRFRTKRTPRRFTLTPR